MKENIETKDVQRTEYLDKNGLDMLWAKVKENTHNQVEVERDRATTQENRIIETKADKSELHSSYVSNSTFTALQEKVAANTDAISDKQDAGNYLRYKTLNNEGYYEIPAIRIPDSGDNNKTDIDSQSISVNCSYPDSHTTITCDGISNTDNNANHVYATDGSIADLTLYAKKTEIPTAATKEKLGVVKVGDGLNVTDGTISVGNYIPYESIDGNIDYKTYVMKHNEGILFDSGSGDVSIQDGEIHVKSDVSEICITPSFIWLQEISGNIKTLLFDLNENGLWLRGGDDNHVLTSHASTIDIREYALKSVYDKKIAALEARIAALEAKHAETA